MSLAEGLFKATVKGGMVVPVRLCPDIRIAITLCLNEEKEHTSSLTQERFEIFMAAANWLEHKLDNTVTLFKPMDKEIALELLEFCNRNGDEHPEAMQWILNHVNKKYSLFELRSS